MTRKSWKMELMRLRSGLMLIRQLKRKNTKRSKRRLRPLQCQFYQQWVVVLVLCLACLEVCPVECLEVCPVECPECLEVCPVECQECLEVCQVLLQQQNQLVDPLLRRLTKYFKSINLFIPFLIFFKICK